MYENVIIVPFRKREPHLAIFIRDALPIFRKYLSPFKVVIVEQADDGQLFNRGQVINIGCNEYKNKTKYIYTHDVDICPTEECVREIYTKIPTTDIMGIYTSCWDTLGGIVKMDIKTYVDINGFPNTYWGWGVEDKALQNRAETYNKTISKNILNNDPKRFDMFSIKNDISDAIRSDDFNQRTDFEYRIFKGLEYDDRLSHIKRTGLNTLKYTVIERRTIDADADVDWMLVSFL
jgi:hypothetical protein